MNPNKETIHHLLSYSYSIYFVGVIVGILADLFFPIRIIPEGIQTGLGLFFLFAGPLFILWAQRSSLRLKEQKTCVTKDCFKIGPYAFSRRPTHTGLFFTVLGFALLSNSVVLIGTTVLSFLISRSFVLKQENLLAERYGEAYLKYKREVTSWF